MKVQRLIAAALAACLLAAIGYGQDEDGAAKLAALGKKAAAVETIHFFAYAKSTFALDTDKPRVEEPSMLEVWYDAKNGLMRAEEVHERSAQTMLVNEKGAFRWGTRQLSPKVAGKVQRRDRAECLPSKDKVNVEMGPAAFLLDALNAYSALRKTFAIRMDAEKDEMGLANVTWFLLTPDAAKDDRWAHELKDSLIRLAVDNDSGLAVCLRMEGPKSRMTVTVPRVETGVAMKDVFVLPPAVVAAGIIDAKTGKPVAD